MGLIKKATVDHLACDHSSGCLAQELRDIGIHDVLLFLDLRLLLFPFHPTNIASLLSWIFCQNFVRCAKVGLRSEKKPKNKICNANESRVSSTSNFNGNFKIGPL